MTATCPRCGSDGPHNEAPAKPPHHLRMDCGNCGRFLRFIPKPGNESRRDPDAWRWKCPTPKQIEIIKRSPKWSWVEPINRYEAWCLVGQILREAEAE